MPAETMFVLTSTEVTATKLELKDGLTHVTFTEVGSDGLFPNTFHVVLGDGGKVSLGDRYRLNIVAED